jgi:hypothetical protein
VSFGAQSSAVQAKEEYNEASVDGRIMSVQLIADRVQPRQVQSNRPSNNNESLFNSNRGRRQEQPRRERPKKQQQQQQPKQQPKAKKAKKEKPKREAKPAISQESLDAEMDAWAAAKKKATEPAPAGDTAAPAETPANTE